MVDVGDLCQKPFFSGGEGYGIDQRHCASMVAWQVLENAHGKVDTTVIDN